MQLSNIRLLIKDMNVSLAFYRDTLGFAVLFADPDGEYAELNVGGNITLALFGRTQMAQAVGTANRPAYSECQDVAALVFGVKNVDEAVAQMQAKGVTIDTEAQDRPGWMMRTAHFRDPDGNLIEINQALYEDAEAATASGATASAAA